MGIVIKMGEPPKVKSEAHLTGHLDASSPLEQLIAQLNKTHAIISRAGKPSVLTEMTNTVTGNQSVSYSNFSDFRNLYCSIHVIDPNSDPEKPKKMSLGKAWLCSPDRREFVDVIFSPRKDVAGYFNLWQGFAYKPIKGNCDLFLKHWLEVVCGGDIELFDYCISWMAQAVQEPSNKPGTSIVLRGKQGTGKTLAISFFAVLFGKHHTTIAHPRHLTGNFNSHLETTLLLQMEEAFWAGNKSAEGIIKDLITGDSLQVEKKGVDVTSATNYIRLMVSSNQEWVVPAGKEERRHLVLDVSDAHMQDKSYFKALADQMNNGGHEALLHHLLTLDISDIDLRTIPTTKALEEQKFQSMTGYEKFWFERLQEGEINPDYPEGWPDMVPCNVLRNIYLVQIGKASNGYKGFETEFGLALGKLCPSIIKKRKVLQTSNSQPVSVYFLPSLDQCRADFMSSSGMTIEWQNLELDGDPPFKLPDLLNQM